MRNFLKDAIGIYKHDHISAVTTNDEGNAVLHMVGGQVLHTEIPANDYIKTLTGDESEKADKS